jgi:hypothetical protein
MGPHASQISIGLGAMFPPLIGRSGWDLIDTEWMVHSMPVTEETSALPAPDEEIVQSSVDMT